MKTIEAEILEDENKAPILKDIKYPVKMEDLDALMNDFKDIPAIDLDADDETVGEQYQFVLGGHKRFVKARTSIEKVRKELKAPALGYGKKVDAIAKEFQAKIKPFEDKLSIQRLAVENNEARKQREAEEAEERRVEEIHRRMTYMERVPLEMMQKPSIEIREFIDSFDIPTEKDFNEFYDKALILHSQIQTQLMQMADDKELVENAQAIQAQKEKEAAEAEAQRQEQLKKEREEFEEQQRVFQKQKDDFEAQQRAVQEEADRKEAERLADELQAKQEAENREREKREATTAALVKSRKKAQDIKNRKESFETLDYQLNSQNVDIETLIDLIQDDQVPHIRWED